MHILFKLLVNLAVEVIGVSEETVETTDYRVETFCLAYRHTTAEIFYVQQDRSGLV